MLKFLSKKEKNPNRNTLAENPNKKILTKNPNKNILTTGENRCKLLSDTLSTTVGCAVYYSRIRCALQSDTMSTTLA